MSDLSEDSSCASWHFDTEYCPWEPPCDARASISSGQGAPLPRVGGAHQYAVFANNALRRAPGIVNRDLVAQCFKQPNRIGREAALDLQFIWKPLVMNAHRLGRLRDVHAEIDDVEDDFRDDRDDPRTARRAGDKFEFAVAKNQCGRHRRQRPLAWPRRVGGAANESIGIWSARFCREIVELVIEKNACPFGDEVEAIGKIQGVSVGNRIAVVVYNRKMRRLIAFV